MSDALPRARSDLVVREQHTAIGTIFVVKDRVSGLFFRLGEEERFILEQLDGATALDVVRRRTEQKFDVELQAHTLSAFVGNLEKKGLLDTGRSPRSAKTGWRGRLRGSALYLRISLFDPDQLFGRLARRLRFMYTARFIGAAAVLMLLALGITLANWGEITRSASTPGGPLAIPLFFVFLVLIVAVHEAGHGVTCKHFGGEVHETGILLMYFFPAFYCNVSDAWLFTHRSQRLWVGLAGPFVELFLWSLATIAWRLTETDSWISQGALIVMTLSGIRTLLNFNPLLKLDGYYLLSDYLEIPNLRSRSFRYVGDLLRWVSGSTAPIAFNYSLRERRVFLRFGALAAISSLFAISYAFTMVGGLLQGGQSEAVLVVTGLVGIKSRRRFRRMFGKSSASTSADDGDGDVMTATDQVMSEPAEQAETDQGATEEVATQRATAERTSTEQAPTERASSEPASTQRASTDRASSGRKKRTKRSRWSRRRALWVALGVAIVALPFFGSLDLRMGGPFVVLPQANADGRTAVAGIVEQILVDEGDRVRAGAVIARLSDKDLRADLDKNAAQRRESSANLRRLTAGPTAEEIEVARASVASAETESRFARSKLARSRSLFEGKMSSQQEFEDVQAASSAVESRLAEANSRLNVLLRGTRREAVTAAEAQLDLLDAERRRIEMRLAQLNVVSPVSGIVATPSRELHAMTGQFVGQGALIAKIFDVSTVTAKIVIAEKEVADIHKGQLVRLRSRAYPDSEFTGLVTTIATSAEGSVGTDVRTATAASVGTGYPLGQTFIVTTQIGNPLGLLKPGMTGLAKVNGGARRPIDLIKRRVARTLRVEFWSWSWWTG